MPQQIWKENTFPTSLQKQDPLPQLRNLPLMHLITPLLCRLESLTNFSFLLSVDFVKWSSQGMLRMNPDAMNALFKPTVDHIIDHLCKSGVVMLPTANRELIVCRTQPCSVLHQVKETLDSRAGCLRGPITRTAQSLYRCGSIIRKRLISTRYMMGMSLEVILVRERYNGAAVISPTCGCTYLWRPSALEICDIKS